MVGLAGYVGSGVNFSKIYPHMRPPLQCSLRLRDDPMQCLRFESFPESIDEAYTAHWDTDLGRMRTSEALFARYSGGGYSNTTLTLTFLAGNNTQIEPGQGSPNNYFIEMEKKVRWCQALLFPRPLLKRIAAVKSSTSEGDPPIFIITYGEFLTFTCVATSFNVSWKSPFDPTTVRPFFAEVILGVERIGTFYHDWYDITGVVDKSLEVIGQQEMVRETTEIANSLAPITR